jgi:Spy/CpxP family protein refolding chaperone
MMTKTLTLAVAAMVLAWVLPALAGDATSPGAPTQPQTPVALPVNVVAGDTGDIWLNQAFRAANVTDAQKVKLKPLLDDVTHANHADATKFSELQAKVLAAVKAKDPELEALKKQFKNQQAEAENAMADRRQRVMAALPGVLSAEQMKAAQDQFERNSLDPAIRARPVARDWINTVTPGVTLSDEQQTELQAKLVAVQGKFAPEMERVETARTMAFLKANTKDPNYINKILADSNPKLNALRAARAKAMNEAVEAALSPEQREQAARGRQEAWKKIIHDWQESMVKSFEPAALTDDQLAKAKALADAAGQAMLKTELYDADTRVKLFYKLRDDIKALLTNEQRAKVP